MRTQLIVNTKRILITPNRIQLKRKSSIIHIILLLISNSGKMLHSPHVKTHSYVSSDVGRCFLFGHDSRFALHQHDVAINDDYEEERGIVKNGKEDFISRVRSSSLFGYSVGGKRNGLGITTSGGPHSNARLGRNSLLNIHRTNRCGDHSSGILHWLKEDHSCLLRESDHFGHDQDLLGDCLSDGQRIGLDAWCA